MSDVTQLLQRIESGEAHATEQLLPLVYDELRNLAAQKLAGEKPGQTLQATALVHEAYLRLVGSDKSQSNWENRAHFFGSAAQAMRRILVENARRKRGPKLGGRYRRVQFETDDIARQAEFDEASTLDMLALDEALTRLSQVAPDRANLVQLRFFAGLTMTEAANVLGISRATAVRQWAYARAWLYAELNGQDSDDTPADRQFSDTERL